ncbi:MAG: DUF86 domain-containing protein [Cyclobacteriaceae bacterium]
MKGNLADQERLAHILEAISEIDSYIKDSGLEQFLGHSMMRFAAIKQIEIIGEAANHLSEATKSQLSDVEWSQIVGMRNILVHEYFGIDFEIIWQIIIEDIPILKTKIERVIKFMGN